MAVTFLPRDTSALSQAFEALRSEETEVLNDLADLQTRLETLRSAMASMKSLMPASKEVSPAQTVFKLSDAQQGRFAGMQFSKALKNFLDTQREPLSTRDVTIKFEEAGWNFAANTFDNKINQVGVSLRRNENTFFKRTHDQKWYSVDSIAALA